MMIDFICIPDEDNIYRLVHLTSTRGTKAIPKAFSLHPADNNKLSVDWDHYTTPEESIARFGATYKSNQRTFKNPREFRVFILKSGYVKSLPGISNIYHDPIKNNPIPKGKPNNPAHSLIDCDLSNPENEPELLQKLIDHAIQVENVDFVLVDSLTNSLKSEWNI